MSNNPTDLWALHALAHVYEMQGRVSEREAAINAVAGKHKDFNLFRGHLWWHLSLFLLSQNKIDAVLDVFDSEIFPTQSTFYLDLQNAASLLARLEI